MCAIDSACLGEEEEEEESWEKKEKEIEESFRDYTLGSEETFRAACSHSSSDGFVASSGFLRFEREPAHTRRATGVICD